MKIAFTDIVGMDLAKQALMLLAVDPALGGVVIPSAVGSGKSTLARAFADILPEGTPFVELPLNVTEDRLIGGVDLEATLASGVRVVQHGVLSKADGGVLYVDSLSLLDSSAVSHIMDAMSRGEVLVEREGLSEVHPANFMLVGTYDPTDGEVRMGLLDRIGIIVPFTAQNDFRARKKIVDVVLGKRNLEDTRDELKMLAGFIDAAKEQLPLVSITKEQVQALIQTALSLGVEGNRVDIFTVRAALASAALQQRSDVDEEDMKLAIKLVLIPRATRMPEREEAAEEMGPEEAPPPEEEPQDGEEEQQPDNSTDADAEEEKEETPDMIEELMMEAIETELPDNIMNISLASKKKSTSGSRGEALNNRRGRFVRAQPGEMRSGKVALIPTLISAAPWQETRKKDKKMAGRPKTALIISKDDVKIKRFRDKSGTLFIFMVDASGSMALNRMRQAKGAVASLLQNAYVHRDQVALISFRGKQAQVLLPPSQSVDRAKRELDVLPTGGGTPLASALYLGWETAKQARTKGVSQIMFVLITDGRGNIGLQSSFDPNAEKPSKEDLEKEVEALSLSVQSDGIASVVIDTQMNYLSRGEAPKLAQKLGGRYLYLPNAKAEQIVDAALSF
ncbi:magnesium chelatase ATPase subunit D [Pelodictyon luteolum]|uniref:Mg-protoporphyrin IX chelatase n=1 Tax=Chlorobium luteolum (strain DSM 273 / BCRC 81028 / 2530) TaxID=319225 RepID=Q3B4S2_CHLL3|nr:magnesium chelatase ATPase subunit D [Pelodictyon luteolum]ABB23659.1 protoporphyrin IX magnesium-chelatase [Pelodictyon luteolum DSM 273]